MKKVLIALLILPCIAMAQTTTLDFDNAESATKLVQTYVAALQSGDITTMNDQLADNAMIYNLGKATDSLTVSQHGAYFTTSAENYNHSISQDLYLPVKVTDSWNAGEWVLSWGVNTITSKSSGEVITVPYHTASLVENGKIVALHYFYDLLNVREKQGFKILPPSK